MTNYQLGDMIESGGMGAVYRGRHVGLERDVAIKFILPHVASDEAAVERFLREARLAARINHPNVVHVYDTGVDEQGRPFIVMELLSGEPLKQRLTRGPMTESDAVEIAKQVLMALEKAHAMNVIHRDIKPGNIFLCTDRVVKILDFGVAKGLDVGNVTMAGKTVGSPAYMSPEQAEGNTVDHRTDLYSVGIVLYELLAGSVPFKGENSFAIMQKHLSAAPPSLPSGVSSQLKAVVEKALAKKPDKRFASAQDMRLALEKVPARNVVVASAATPTPGHTPQPTPVPDVRGTVSAETTTKKKSMAAPIIGVSLAAVAAAAFFLVPMLTQSSASGGPKTNPDVDGGSTAGTNGSNTAGNTGTNGGIVDPGPATEVKQEIKTEPIAFQTERKEDPNLPKGEEKVQSEGEAGEAEITFSVTYKDGKEVDRKEVGRRESKAPVNRVVLVGTGAGTADPGAGATTTAIREERRAIPFRTETIWNPNMRPGVVRTIQEGREGLMVITWEDTKRDGKVIASKKLDTQIVTRAQNRKIEKCRPRPEGGGSTSGGTGGPKRRPWFCPDCGERRGAEQNVCPNDGTHRPAG